jgi:ubiquinone/menaquinone biosynthesis C-methylase UbiE
MPMTLMDVCQLRCPMGVGKQPFRICKQPLRFRGDADRHVQDGVLSCVAGHRFGVRGGVPFLVDESTVGETDALLRPIYDMIAPVHDLGVEYLLPLLQFPDPRAGRGNYLHKLELRGLAPGRHGITPRILEVGIGTGANVPLLDTFLPFYGDVEIWGVDLSMGMLDEARRRFAGRPTRAVRLALADAHALPFDDSSFDRVFHVGGVNGYRDPQRALAEMARVAKPKTPIVVVDEELDPRREHLALHRILFRALTAYDPNPHAPREALPADVEDVEISPVSRFYYCLRFRKPMPVAEEAAAPGSEAKRGA